MNTPTPSDLARTPRPWLPNALLVATIAVLGTAALYRLGKNLAWLTSLAGPTNPVDIGFYHRWVHRWFAGVSVYNLPEHPEYPPASMVLLAPLVGWASLAVSQWWWAVTTVGALWVLVRRLIAESGASTWQTQTFVALLLLSIGGTGTAIGNGQLVPYVLPLLLSGVLLLHQRRPAPGTDALAAALLVASLVKPSLSAPFMWLAVFVRRELRVRPLVLVGTGYLLLTAFAVQFQAVPLRDLLLTPVRNGAEIAALKGYANVHYFLGAAGLPSLGLPVSIGIWLALGAWVYVRRTDDVWHLLGVTAVVARIWTYHRVYDNVLLVIPEVALWRLLVRGEDSRRAERAGLLLAVNIIVLLLPAASGVVEAAHSVVILLDLVFFLTLAPESSTGPVAPPQT